MYASPGPWPLPRRPAGELAVWQVGAFEDGAYVLVLVLTKVMALVEYLMRARSPHSNGLKEPGDLEWVRVYEVDPQIHCVVRAEARRSGTDVEYSGGLTDTAL